MKLKYYLRGLGIGVAVMAVIWMMAGGAKESLTDEEIKERAKELGMVESVTLSQLDEESEDTKDSSENAGMVSEEASLEEEESTAGNTSEENDVEASEDSNTSGQEDNNASTEDSEEEEDSSVQENSETTSENTSEPVSEEDIEEFVVIVVGPGDGSGTVSAKLEAAGLVEDARMYDDFLCGNGYDKILQTGTHEIPRTADWDRIAEILAGRG